VTYTEAAALAAALELDVDDIGICHACLSFVSFAIDSGDDHEVACSITRIGPDLWAEGLAQPVRMALRRARERGVPNAEEAIASVHKSGPRSQVTRAIVRRLAADLSARAQGDLFRMGAGNPGRLASSREGPRFRSTCPGRRTLGRRHIDALMQSWPIVGRGFSSLQPLHAAQLAAASSASASRT
jgi:hypothetical protein